MDPVESVDAADVSCDVVLPCRDEAAALPGVLAGLPDGYSAIVVDNGSRDDTAVVARSHGARVVREDRIGYGAAVHAGVLAARADLVAVADADGSMDLRDLERLVPIVAGGEATMAVGRRRPTGRRVWPWHARLGTSLVIRRLRRASGLALRDLAPMRVCRRDDLLALGVEDRRFGYPLELMVRAAAAGWTIREVDIAYGPRADGTRSKVSGSLRGTLRTARDFARVLP